MVGEDTPVASPALASDIPAMASRCAPRLDALQDHRDSLADANAHGAQCKTAVGTF
jgi:hypothetical protein